MSGYRKPYVPKEEEAILQYIIDKNAYMSLRGNAVWKAMENADITDRTWQSMKEHFIKKIVHKLGSKCFGNISGIQLKKIKCGFESTAKKNAARREHTESEDEDCQPVDDKKSTHTWLYDKLPEDTDSDA